MFFQSNFKAGVKERVMYTHVRSIICLANSQPTPGNAQRSAPQTSYTYRLYFDEKPVQLHLPDGQLCVSGKTLVTTTLHPCMATIIARDFLLFNKPPNLEEATKDLLRGFDRVLNKPLFLSWFQDNPCLLHNRAETRAIYDCSLRMPTHAREEDLDDGVA
ncbi:hypothetical protein CPB85DRAFT_287696 [Mucidula mucida]|nr:hypothetical protein CPB85DRAFT_287696 [Mucidula mucida]